MAADCASGSLRVRECVLVVESEEREREACNNKQRSQIDLASKRGFSPALSYPVLRGRAGRCARDTSTPAENRKYSKGPAHVRKFTRRSPAAHPASVARDEQCRGEPRAVGPAEGQASQRWRDEKEGCLLLSLAIEAGLWVARLARICIHTLARSAAMRAKRVMGRCRGVKKGGAVARRADDGQARRGEESHRRAEGV